MRINEAETAYRKFESVKQVCERLGLRMDTLVGGGWRITCPAGTVEGITIDELIVALEAWELGYKFRRSFPPE